MIASVDIGANVLFVGVTQGLVYALLAVGLVLIYRATSVIHFGYGEVGAFGAILLGKLVLDGGWSWWTAMPVVIVVGTLIGAFWERTVVRRLSNASRLVLLVATIGIAQLMFAAQLAVPHVENRSPYPAAFELRYQIGAFTLRGDHVAVLVFVPVIALGLAWFLNRTLAGLAIRGAAQNREAALLAGVPVKRLSTLVWALGGGLATLTVVLLLPMRGMSIGESPVLGPGLLLRALLVALVGRLVSLPMAVVGGLVFGVAESILFANLEPRTVELWVFLGLVALLVLRGGITTGASDAAALAGRIRAVPAQFASHPVARTVPAAIAVAALVFAVALPLIEDNPSRQFAFAKVLIYVIIALSVVVITGWAGQLSLCQFAFVGLGAYTTAALTARGMPFVWAALNATIITTVAATGIGFPALRLRGLFLAVITLGFAQAASTWLFVNDVFASDTGVLVVRGTLGPLDLGNQRTYYYLCLVVLLVVAVLLAGLRRSGVGRAIVAVRENEAAASASTLSPTTVKLLAFAVSGAVAGLGGALLGGLFGALRVADFGPQQSILVLSMAIIGGVGSLTGAFIGALYMIGIPNLFGAGTLVTVMVSGVGLMILVLFLPGGLIALVHRIRDRLISTPHPIRSLFTWSDRTFDPQAVSAWLRSGGPPPKRSAPASHTGSDAATRAEEEAAPVRRFASSASIRPREVKMAPGIPAIACSGVVVRFGGLVAVDAVDLCIEQGELVGLIGTNGAGKSTLMNAIGGYVPTASGKIEVLGRDVTRRAAHERARLGVGRVFQDARLFGELTVRECVMVALEARARSEFIPSLLGLPPALRVERAKRAAADDLITLTGLGRYADTAIAELSTGTRRIVELASLIAGGSRLLLLDEPTGGVAQREVEAFGGVLQDVRQQLDATILLIEHDMPLVMALSSRIVCMTAGHVIAEGPPDLIRNDPRVIAAYLGTDERAIERSDALVGART